MATEYPKALSTPIPPHARHVHEPGAAEHHPGGEVQMLRVTLPGLKTNEYGLMYIKYASTKF